MSTRTIASLITECETRFKDTTNRIITEPEWATYIAEAFDEIVSTSPDWPFLRDQDEVNVSLVAGDNEVSLDAVLAQVPYRLTGVYNKTGEAPMIALPNDALAWEMFPPSTAQGEPTHYQFFARLGAPSLKVYPTPDRSTVFYVSYINETSTLHGLDTSAKPPIPNQYLQALVHGALARAYEDDHEWQAASVHHGRFQMTVERMRVDLLLPNTPGYPGINDTFGS